MYRKSNTKHSLFLSNIHFYRIVSYRNELKSVEIITFDELLVKVKILIQLLKG